MRQCDRPSAGTVARCSSQIGMDKVSGSFFSRFSMSEMSHLQRRVRGDDIWVLARGQTVEGPRWFRVEEHLGRGAFAAAYRATDEAGEEYFLKEYLPPDRPRQVPERLAMYRQERRILMRVSHHELCPTLHAAFADS